MAADNIYYLNSGSAKVSVKQVGVAELDAVPAINVYTEDPKQLFYLDGFLNAKIKYADGTSKEGFIGCIEDNVNSDNYQHHNPARFHKLRIPIKDSNGIVKHYILLNDAGLNTRGDVDIAFKEYVNIEIGVVFTLSLKSAHHVDTDQYGMSYSINADSYGDFTYPQFYPKQTTNLKDIAIRGGQPDDIIHIRGIIVNAEGSYFSSQLNYTVPFLPWVVTGETQYASQAPNSTIENTLYPASYPIEIGTIIYPNATKGVPYVRIDNGYYADDINWYQLSDNNAQDCTVLAKGALGFWPVDDPAYEPPASEWQVINYVHWTTVSIANGCAVMSSGNRTNITLYKHLPTGIYYITQNTSGTKASTGTYYDGTTAAHNGAYNFIQIVSGYFESEGNCTDGITGF